MKLKKILSGALAGAASAIVAVLFNVTASAAGEVAINATNFPDEAFRIYVGGAEIDKNNDKVLSQEELDAVTEINLCGFTTKIASLSGIEYFTNLTSLNCKGHQLTALDLSGNKNLTNLNCLGNNLTSLDVSGNKKLTNLDCFGNKLTSLDVSNNTALEYLHCAQTEITTLDLSSNTALKELYCFDIPKLKDFDLSKNTALMVLSCGATPITSLDLSNCNNLELLYITECTSLKSLKVDANLYPSFAERFANDIKVCTELEELSIKNCDFNSLNISSFEKLSSLDLSGCKIGDFYGSLSICNTKLTSLDLSNVDFVDSGTGCSFLSIGNNSQLKNLNLSNVKATHIFLDVNDAISSIDMSGCTELKVFSLSGDEIKSVDLSEFKKLESFTFYYGGLTSLDVSKNTLLKELYLAETEIKTLDLSKNPDLEKLECINTKLKLIDAGRCSALSSMNVAGSDSLQKVKLYCKAEPAVLENGYCNWEKNKVDPKLPDPSIIEKIHTWDSGKEENGTTVYTCTVCGHKSTDTPDPDPVPATTPVIWAGGKDIKNRTDESKSVYYKTCSYQNEGMYSGGKWCVAVTKSDIATADDFAALFKDGKLTDAGKKNTGDAKKIASAKIKDGKITVTAGKEAGAVNVWLYEVKGKAVVNDSALGVVPKATAVSVLMAANSPVLAESLTNGVASSGVSKLEVKAAESKKLLLGDKKTAFDPTASFTLENSSTANATAVLSGNELTVTGVSAGKANITLTCDQSGKKVKLAVTCK